MLLSAQDIIANSITLYKKHWKLFLQYSVLYLVPSVGVTGTTALFAPELLTTGELTTTGMSLVLYVLFNILFSFVAVWISIALVKVLVDTYEDKPVQTMSEVFTWSRRHFIPAIIVSILVGIIVFFGLLFLIIPGIILSIYYTFAFYEVITEDKRGMDALRSGKALVEGRWWAVLWRLAMPLLIFLIVIGIIQWALLLPFSFGNNIITETISGIIAAVITVFSTPLTSAAASILYVELKRTPLSVTAAEGEPTPRNT